MSKPLKIFITYAHKNNEAKNQLIECLAVMKRQGLIRIWHDNEIIAGDKWRDEIFATQLPDSDILLYLVSTASLASGNCNKELALALNYKIRVIPIILESCDWLNHQLSDFQALPDKGLPIANGGDEKAGWQNVVEGIREVVNKIQVPTSHVAKEEVMTEWVFQQGNFLMMLDEIDRAIEAYSHVIEFNPRNAHAYNNRGVAYSGIGDYDRGINDFNKAIELNPNFSDPYINRGAVYGKQGDFCRAIEEFNTAMKLDCEAADIYYNRGLIYGKMGDIDGAIENYSKAIGLDPNFSAPYINRGAAYGKTGDFDRAVKDLDKAIELKPYDSSAHQNRGMAHYTKGEFDSAVKDCTKAIALKPNAVKARQIRGMAYVKKGEINRAIEDYSKVLRLDSEFALAYSSRGEAWLHLQEWDKARTDLVLARERGVDLVAAFHNDYASVSYFEQKNNVKLPEDIAAMLTPETSATRQGEVQHTTSRVDLDVKIAIKKIKKKYKRAWKTLAEL